MNPCLHDTRLNLGAKHGLRHRSALLAYTGDTYLLRRLLCKFFLVSHLGGVAKKS